MRRSDPGPIARARVGPRWRVARAGIQTCQSEFDALKRCPATGNWSQHRDNGSLGWSRTRRSRTVGRGMRSGPSEGLEREGPLHPCLVTDAGVTSCYAPDLSQCSRSRDQVRSQPALLQSIRLTQREFRSFQALRSHRGDGQHYVGCPVIGPFPTGKILRALPNSHPPRSAQSAIFNR